MDNYSADRELTRLPAARRPTMAGPTNRQAQALAFAAHGFTPRETAAALDLSPRSIEDYLATGKRAIGASSRAEIVQWAIRRELFPSRPGFLDAAIQETHRQAD